MFHGEGSFIFWCMFSGSFQHTKHLCFNHIFKMAVFLFTCRAPSINRHTLNWVCSLLLKYSQRPLFSSVAIVSNKSSSERNNVRSLVAIRFVLHRLVIRMIVIIESSSWAHNLIILASYALRDLKTDSDIRVAMFTSERAVRIALYRFKSVNRFYFF